MFDRVAPRLLLRRAREHVRRVPEAAGGGSTRLLRHGQGAQEEHRRHEGGGRRGRGSGGGLHRIGTSEFNYFVQEVAKKKARKRARREAKALLQDTSGGVEKIEGGLNLTLLAEQGDEEKVGESLLCGELPNFAGREAQEEEEVVDEGGGRADGRGLIDADCPPPSQIVIRLSVHARVCC